MSEPSSARPSWFEETFRFYRLFLDLAAGLGIVVTIIAFFLGADPYILMMAGLPSFTLLVVAIFGHVHYVNDEPFNSIGEWRRGYVSSSKPFRDPFAEVDIPKLEQIASRPIIPPHDEVLQEIERRYELKKLEPNLLEMAPDSVSAHEDENGVIVTGDASDANTFRAHFVPYSNESRKRKVAALSGVSFELTYVCYVGPQGTWKKIHRGAWLSERDTAVNFAANGPPHRAIVATAEGDDRVYAVRRDFDSGYKGVITTREELAGNVYGLTVALLAESRTGTVQSFTYILEIARTPNFEIRLTNALMWKSEHLYNFISEGTEFLKRINEIWQDAKEQVPIPVPSDTNLLSSWGGLASLGSTDKFDYDEARERIRAIERGQEEKLLDAIKDWETQSADWAGLYVSAEQRDLLKRATPSVEDGFNRTQKPRLRAFQILSRNKDAAPAPSLPYWQLSDAVLSRTELLLKIVDQLRVR